MSAIYDTIQSIQLIGHFTGELQPIQTGHEPHI